MPLALIVGVLVGSARMLSGVVFTPLSAALTPGTVSEMRPRAEAADEFERVFADLVSIDKGKRLIIAVDDVDRLAPERLLETLHAIHSFQRACKHPRPVFIVSFDERIVRDAIAVARPGSCPDRTIWNQPRRRTSTACSFIDSTSRLISHEICVAMRGIFSRTAVTAVLQSSVRVLGT